MSLQAKDISNSLVQESWVEAGLKYSLLSWSAHFNRMGKANPYSRIEKIVIGRVAEEAVISTLKKLKIDFDLSGRTKWYEKDIYDIGIAGHQVDVKSNFLDLNSAYFSSRIPTNNEDLNKWILKFHGLVPADQINERPMQIESKDKLYLFSYVEGAFREQSERELKKNVIHAFWDYRWLKRGDQKNSAHLGKLEFKKKSSSKVSIEIYGTTSKNQAKIEIIDIAQETVTKNSFFQVFAIRILEGAIDENLEINALDANLVETILPKFGFDVKRDANKQVIEVQNNWWNINLVESRCHLAGFSDETSFRVNSEFFPRFTKTIEQYSEIKVDNYGLPVRDLKPITELKNYVK